MPDKMPILFSLQWRRLVAANAIEFHPLANIFPLLEGHQFRELVEDIRVHGLRDPIVLFDGAILDGRNRYRACQAAQVGARFETYRGKDAMSYVVSVNLHRRHLDASQRAMIAAEIADFGTNEFGRRGRPRKEGARGSTGRLLEPLKKSNHGNAQFPPDNRVSGVFGDGSGLTLEAASALMNVSDASIRDAKHILLKGSPSLIAAVKSGEASVGSGKEFAKLPKKQQNRIIASGGPSKVKALGRNVRTDRLLRHRVDRAAAGASTVAVFDFIKIGDGRALGNIRIGEIESLAQSLIFISEVLLAVRGHFANPDHSAKIREAMKESALSEIIDRARTKRDQSSVA